MHSRVGEHVEMRVIGDEVRDDVRRALVDPALPLQPPEPRLHHDAILPREQPDLLVRIEIRVLPEGSELRGTMGVRIARRFPVDGRW